VAAPSVLLGSWIQLKAAATFGIVWTLQLFLLHWLNQLGFASYNTF